MRRFLRSFRGFLSFLPVLAILGLFVLLAFETSDPLQRVEKEILATGSVVPDADLRRRGPLQSYVALHAGAARSALPATPVDDALAEEDGSFALRADARDGARFFVFVRVEAADFSTYCTTIPLPPARPGEDGTWKLAGGGPVPALRIEVASTDGCAQ